MIGGTGDSLPEVTEADNGKILTVVDGQWNKSDALNGNTGIITLNIIGNDNTPPDYALQENWGDIASELLNSSDKHVYMNQWFQANPGDPLMPSALGVPASYQYDGEDFVYIYASVPDGESSNLRCYNILGSYDAEYPTINVGDFQLTIA